MAPEYNGGCRLYLLGHTEWSDGNSHATGFTTAWPPNKFTPWTRRASTWISTASMKRTVGRRSRPSPRGAGIALGVQSLMGDGSVQYYGNSIDPNIWRALGSVSGGEWAGGDPSATARNSALKTRRDANDAKGIQMISSDSPNLPDCGHSPVGR